MAQVWIPALLRSLTGGKQTVEAAGETVLEVIDNLDALYPGLKARLCEGERLRPTITLVVDGEASTVGLRHRLQPESEIHFVPSISGG